MCMGAPKIEAPPPPAQMQTMQNPKDLANGSGLAKKRRRGLMAAIFTSANGIASAPTVTGGSGGSLGG